MKRHHLPDTRASVTHRIEHVGDLDIYVTVGFFEPDAVGVEQPGEIFIKIGKEGSTLSGLADAIGCYMSLLLQSEVAWERVAHKVRATTFEPRNANGHSFLHAVAEAVDEILQDIGSMPEKGYGCSSEE